MWNNLYSAGFNMPNSIGYVMIFFCFFTSEISVCLHFFFNLIFLQLNKMYLVATCIKLWLKKLNFINPKYSSRAKLFKNTQLEKWLEIILYFGIIRIIIVLNRRYHSWTDRLICSFRVCRKRFRAPIEGLFRPITSHSRIYLSFWASVLRICVFPQPNCAANWNAIKILF